MVVPGSILVTIVPVIFVTIYSYGGSWWSARDDQLSTPSGPEGSSGSSPIRVPGQGCQGLPPLNNSQHMNSDNPSDPVTSELIQTDDQPRTGGDYLVLARRWRPKTFAQLVGQQPVVQALENGLNANRVHHAFLFTGTRGVGKTTLARILAKCLNCETGVSATPCGVCTACSAIDDGRFVDLIEVDAASRTKVEDTRELLDNVQFAPTSGRYKIYLIDEVHMLSGHSFNALLKTLEEPPPHVKFILATTDPQKLPVTILSRCLRFNLRRVEADELRTFMQQKLQTEGLANDAAALQCIAQAADGSVRDALSLLDQALSYASGELEPEAIKTMLGLVSDRYIEALLEALLVADAAALLDVSAEINAAGNSPARVLTQLAQALHRISVVQLLPDYEDPSEPAMAVLKAVSKRLSPEDVQLFYQIAIKGQDDLRLAPDPRIGLEMTLMRMLAFRPVSALTPGGEEPSRRQLAEQGQQLSTDASAAPAQAAAMHADQPQRTDQLLKPEQHRERQDSSVQPTAVSPDRHGRSNNGSAGVKQSNPAATSAEHAAAAIGATGRDKKAAASTPASLPLQPDQWPALCPKLGLQGPTMVLASHLQLQRVDADAARVVFLLAADDLHLRIDDSIDELRECLATRLATDIDLHIEISHEELMTPASTAVAADDQRHQQAVLAAQHDPVMHAMMHAFDAEIVPGSVKPSTFH